jgi:hypothetical protein
MRVLARARVSRSETLPSPVRLGERQHARAPWRGRVRVCTAAMSWLLTAPLDVSLRLPASAASSSNGEAATRSCACTACRRRRFFIGR